MLATTCIPVRGSNPFLIRITLRRIFAEHLPDLFEFVTRFITSGSSGNLASFFFWPQLASCYSSTLVNVILSLKLEVINRVYCILVG